MTFLRSIAKLHHRPRVTDPEWLVVGLGNPGGQYAKTRHNIGFMCVNRLAHRSRVRFHHSAKLRADIAAATVLGRSVLLAQPQTFMNASGMSVGRLSQRHRLSPEHVLVLYDDVDLPFGSVRIREEGSSGGHRGMQSVIDVLGTSGVPRIRIGIGRAGESGGGGRDTAGHVLSEFMPQQRAQLPELCDFVADAVECIVSDGVVAAMNRYNGVALPGARVS